ncbi:MAG: CoA transferase, partial [Hyphomicrobiaceae bacterium]
KRTSDEWVAKLEGLRIPISKVRNVGEVCADPQLDGRGIIADIPDPDDSSATLKVPAAAFIASADGPAVPGAPPTLGADTHDVLHALGYSDAEIAALEIT